MKNTIQFFNEVNRLKSLKRKGWVDKDVKDSESVAEHSYRMAVMAVFLTPENLDREKIIRMALVHDLGEIDNGDITPHDGVSDDIKHAGEKKGIERLASYMDEKNSADLISLWEEYNEKKTSEALFVKDLDILEMMLQADEYEKEQKDNINQERWDFWEYSDERLKHPKIREIFEELKKQRNVMKG
ncbi:MAG: HD domain-containing protein [Nanoarchaeota archaeon]|nr:HD domain-containing protein [Nanoarchaeota archaeon]